MGANSVSGSILYFVGSILYFVGSILLPSLVESENATREEKGRADPRTAREVSVQTVDPGHKDVTKNINNRNHIH